MTKNFFIFVLALTMISISLLGADRILSHRVLDIVDFSQNHHNYLNCRTYKMASFLKNFLIRLKFVQITLILLNQVE